MYDIKLHEEAFERFWTDQRLITRMLNDKNMAKLCWLHGANCEAKQSISVINAIRRMAK